MKDLHKIIEQFLNTVYSGPLHIDRESSGGHYFAYVMHGSEIILTGQVYSGSNFSHTLWGSPFEVFFRINHYISADMDVIESVLVNWIRVKCESQGIPFTANQ